MSAVTRQLRLRYSRGSRPRHGHVRTPGHAYARMGVLLGQQAVHLVHSACFDSVLFLSQFLDTIHEPGS